jgi:hypothetical protein
VASTGESVTFPAGALDADTVITLEVFDASQVAAPPSGQALISHAINLLPEGVTFDPPVTITLPYTDADLIGGDTSSLKIWVYVNGGWQSLGGTVNKANHTVSVTVSHFTLYALMRSTAPAATPAGLPPQSAPMAAATPATNGETPEVSAIPNAGGGSRGNLHRDEWAIIVELAALAIGGSLFAAGLGRRRR